MVVSVGCAIKVEFSISGSILTENSGETNFEDSNIELGMSNALSGL